MPRNKKNVIEGKRLKSRFNSRGSSFIVALHPKSPEVEFIFDSCSSTNEVQNVASRGPYSRAVRDEELKS